MIGHWLFVQAERPEVTGENVVMFKETREGTTPAVQYWYFPGERIGKEFIYPKDQADFFHRKDRETLHNKVLVDVPDDAQLFNERLQESEDFYNFDETGIMMGVICSNMVVTRADRRGRGK